MTGHSETLDFVQQLCPLVSNGQIPINYFELRFLFQSLNLHCVRSVNAVEKKQRINAESVPLLQS